MAIAQGPPPPPLLLARSRPARARVSDTANAGAGTASPRQAIGMASLEYGIQSLQADSVQSTAHSDKAALLCSPLCRRPSRPRLGSSGAACADGSGDGAAAILSVLVEGCSAPLAPADGVSHAAVRLHLVSAATGEYLRLRLHGPAEGRRGDAPSSSSGGGGGDPPHQAAAATAAAAGQDAWLVGRAAQAEMLDYAGRPCLSTLANDTAAPAPALLRYLPPVQTRPCDLAAAAAAAAAAAGGMAALTAAPDALGSSGGSIGGGGFGGGGGVGSAVTVAPAWGEAIEFDAAPRDLAAADALLLVEVLEVPGSFREAAAKAGGGRSGVAGGSPAGRRVAWGFARLAALGVGELGGGARRLEVQLYRYHGTASSGGSSGGCSMGGGCGRVSNQPHPETPALAAFKSWRAVMAAGGTAASPARPARLPAADGGGGSSSGSDGAAAAVPLPAPLSPRHRGCAKYPCVLALSLRTVPRPQPSSFVSAAAAHGARPWLPSGYGSGFEVGRGARLVAAAPTSLEAGAPSYSWSCRLASGMRPSSAPCTLGSGGGGCELDPGRPLGGGARAAAALAAERTLHRPFAAPCELPNARAAAAPAPAGGCAALAFSRDGRWLAAVCGRADGRACVAVYHGPTLAPAALLGWHDAPGRVRAVAWSPDDALVATAGDDMTARVWRVPWQRAGSNSGGSGGGNGGSARVLLDVTSGSGSSTSSSSEGAAAAIAVLQHACAVHAAAFCPLPGLSAPRLATAGADGVVRIWDASGGADSGGNGSSSGSGDGDGGSSGTATTPLLLFAAPGLGAPVGALAFDLLGARLYAGDALGRVHEFAVDLAPAAGPHLRHHLSDAPAAAAQSAAAAAQSEAQPQPDGQAPPAPLLRRLRDTGGPVCAGGVAQLRAHPGGRHLLALARGGGSGYGRRRHAASAAAVALDLKLLLPARRFGPMAASVLAPAAVAMAASPDGRYVALMSSDGAVTCHAFNGGGGSGGGVRLRALEAAGPDVAQKGHATRRAGGGAPRALDWSAGFNAVAACALSPYAPIVVACFDARQPPIRPPPLLQQPQQQQRSASDAGGGNASGAATATAAARAGGRAARSTGGGAWRGGGLPERQTPEDVRAMLRALREDAARRGLLPRRAGGADDGCGGEQHLVVAASAADSRQLPA